MGTKTAKLFTTGRSQAVRLPMEFRFEGKEVFIRRDERTGDIILSRRPADWEGLFSLFERESAADDFLDEKDRSQGVQDRDPFDGWSE